MHIPRVLVIEGITKMNSQGSSVEAELGAAVGQDGRSHQGLLDGESASIKRSPGDVGKFR
ncbi:MAG: hypothetical protein ACI9DF_005296 [Verrucomicrobiales bacterium]|jgi:hypothetical protein